MTRRRSLVLVLLGTVAIAVQASAHVLSWPAKQANAGDSISQGFAATGWLGDDPESSWIQGTHPEVGSVFSRYVHLFPAFAQEPESVSGAEMVGGNDNFPAQAARICSQAIRPSRVSVLLGGNDVCNRRPSRSQDAAANLYSVATFTQALRAGLDQLAACLPSDAIVSVLSVPRVDFLYEAGTAKSWWCSYGVWPLAGICRVVTGESNPARRRQLGERIDAYNAAILAEIEALNQGLGGRNSKKLVFTTDWRGAISAGHSGDSVGTTPFFADDINGVDCFHPNRRGQSRLACLAWSRGPEGNPSARCEP